VERLEPQGTYLLAISKKRVAEIVGSFKGFINHGKANRAFLNKSLKNQKPYLRLTQTKQNRISPDL
jgi:hypothetical protein